MNFGERLEEWRKRCGLSQEALAQKLGMSQGYLNKLEKGKRNPPKREKIVKIAIALAQELGSGRRGAIEIANDLLTAALYAPLTEEEQRDLKIGLGAKLAEFRMRTGKSVKELAELAQLTERQWIRIEKEEDIPNLITLVAMIRAIENFTPLTDEVKKQIYGLAGYGKVEPRAIEAELVKVKNDETKGTEPSFASKFSPASLFKNEIELDALVEMLYSIYEKLPHSYRRFLELQIKVLLYWFATIEVDESQSLDRQ